MKRLHGEEFIEHRNRQIQEAVDKIGRVVVGPLILAPTPSEMSEHLGITRGALYHQSSYEEKLEKATGFVVIHYGPVLAENPQLKIDL